MSKRMLVALGAGALLAATACKAAPTARLLAASIGEPSADSPAGRTATAAASKQLLAAPEPDQTGPAAGPDEVVTESEEVREASRTGKPATTCYQLPRRFGGHTVKANLSYKSATFGKRVAASNRYAMDVYLPDTSKAKSSFRGPFPAIIQVHGGGFVTGDKSSFAEASAYYAERGFVAIEINYFLAKADGSDPAYPRAAQDIQEAIRQVRAHAGELKIDPDFIALRGGSAGATLVNLVALAGDGAPFDACRTGCGSVAVQAVVDYYGGADFDKPVSADGNSGLALFGKSPDPAEVAAANPASYVSAGDPPFVIGHGTVDKIVVIEQSRALLARLGAVGVPAELIEVAGAGHGFIEKFSGDASSQVRCREEKLLNDRLLRPLLRKRQGN